MTSGTMAIPIIKRAVKAFHDKHDILKKKGKHAQDRLRQELYKVKGKGQWGYARTWAGRTPHN